jgi:phage FluMu protein Com
MQELYENYYCPHCGALCIKTNEPYDDFIKVKCPKCNDVVCIIEKPKPWGNSMMYTSGDPYYPTHASGWDNDYE